MSHSNGAVELAQKYAIVAELGQGGMSVVHLAAARGLGDVKKLVVLKSIRPELLTSEKVQRMFMDEARLATRLTHPNIVQTYEVVMLGGHPVIVMEYMEGQTFSAVRRRAGEAGDFPLAMQLRILCEVLAGLAYAHDAEDYEGNPLGLIHRDVSPQNVFVTYDGHTKVLDFGIAKTPNNSEQTELGELKGKVRYMAPEQMRGERGLDRRADVFSVGVMLWETLAGKRLWHGATDVDVFNGVLVTGLPSPRTANPNLDERLEQICMKALAQDPNARFASCAEMQLELEVIVQELGLRASNRDVAALMQALFSEVRSSIRLAIENKLKLLDSEPLTLTAPGSGLAQLSLANATGDRASHSQFGALGGTTPPPSRSRFPWVLALLIALLLAGVGTLPALRKLALDVLFTPGVRVSAMSEKSLPVNAAAAQTARSVAELQAVAPEPPKPESNATVPAASVPASASVSAAPKARARVRATTSAEASAAPVSAASPTLNCDRPFYVDAAGIRRVRKECM